MKHCLSAWLLEYNQIYFIHVLSFRRIYVLIGNVFDRATFVGYITINVRLESCIFLGIYMCVGYKYSMQYSMCSCSCTLIDWVSCILISMCTLYIFTRSYYHPPKYCFSYKYLLWINYSKVSTHVETCSVWTTVRLVSPSSKRDGRHSNSISCQQL